MFRKAFRFFRPGASLLLSAVLIVPAVQQKGCDKGAAGKAGTPSAPAATGEFDSAAEERAVRKQVEELRVAFESKQVSGVMRAIVPTELSAYASFEDQVSDLMQATAELRLNFRSANIQLHRAEGPDKLARAQVVVDAEMVYSLKANRTQEKRRTGQLQMDLIQGELGWRFAKIEPRSFFTP